MEWFVFSLLSISFFISSFSSENSKISYVSILTYERIKENAKWYPYRYSCDGDTTFGP